MTEPVYRYRARVIRVIDADTLDLDIDLGFRTSTRQSIRLRGVNAPELSTDAGRAARLAVVARCGLAHICIVETYKDRQTFARWVADVYLDGESLAAWLRAAGHTTSV